MRSKTFSLLIVVMMISIAAAVFAYSRSADDPRYDRIGEKVFPGLIDRVNEVDELIVESTLGRLSMHRKGKIWHVRESDGHIASPNEVSKAIIGVAELAFFEPKTERADRYYRLQLEGPGEAESKSKHIILKIAGQTVADLIVGREKLFLPGRTVGGVYFRVPGTNLSWLGEGNPEAGSAPKDWLAREIVDVDDKRVKSVRVRHPDGEIVAVHKASPMAENFSLADMPPGMKLKYGSDANQIGSFLDQLEMEDVRRVASTDIDWNGAIVVDVETFDGLRGVAETVYRNDIHWLRIRFQAASEEASKEAKLLTAHTSDWVYMMPKYEVVPILRRMRDLLVAEGTNS